MKRFLTLTALLIMNLSGAACGGGEAQQAERAAPSKEKQAAPAAQRVAKANAPQESSPEESTSREGVQGGEGAKDARLSVTTIAGEQVNLGGQGDVTALYFMAGW